MSGVGGMFERFNRAPMPIPHTPELQSPSKHRRVSIDPPRNAKENKKKEPVKKKKEPARKKKEESIKKKKKTVKPAKKKITLRKYPADIFS